MRVCKYFFYVHKIKRMLLSVFECFKIFPFSNRFGCFCPAQVFCPADSKISVGVAAAFQGTTTTVQQGIP